MVVVVLNGASVSSRRKENRTSTLVERLTKGSSSAFLSRRARLVRGRRRTVRSFILGRQDPREGLLLVGKSLGARNIVQVLNGLSWPLGYAAVGLLTIDPNWPLWFTGQLAPNLNQYFLHLIHPVERGVNIYAICPPDRQAGSRIFGEGVENVSVGGVTHESIVRHPIVRLRMETLVDWLK